MLYDDGMINQENLRSARAEDVYILKGEGEEVYEPRFTYHGFRYVEVTGFPGVPTAETIRGRVVHSGVKQTGSFAASKPVLNGLQTDHHLGPEDQSPQHPDGLRSARRADGLDGRRPGHGRGGHDELRHGRLLHEFHPRHPRRPGRDGDDHGHRPPHLGQPSGRSGLGHGLSAAVLVHVSVLRRTRILEEQFDGLKKYVEFLRSKAENGLVKYSYYGDWVAVDKTPGEHRLVVLLLLRRQDPGRRRPGSWARRPRPRPTAELAEEIKAAFHKEYYDPKTGNYANGTQTANALALFLDLAPENARGSAWGNLFDNLAYKNNSHLTTGIIGTKYIMEVLTRFGNSDLAYDIAAQTTYPSWGYMIENGATTLWELWQRREGPSMNSHNHPMFGSVGAWLYKALAGINLDPRAVGFEKIRIEPQMVRDLIYASGSVDTLRGRVSSRPGNADGIRASLSRSSFRSGSEAEIVLPKFTFGDIVIKEGGKAVWAQKNKFVPGVPGILDVQEPKDARS